jgi:hypothetical protein
MEMSPTIGPALNELIAFIAERFRFEAPAYPSLAGKTAEECLVFGIQHNALHVAKTAGKIASVMESVDHGGSLDAEELRKHVSRSLINTLRLAELVGLTGEEMVRAVEEKYRPKTDLI